MLIHTMLFGEQLLKQRKKLHLSAEELAERVSISRSYITLMENGKRLPSKKMIPALAEALKIKTNVVINWYL
ncbi:MAG: helix-turn-helix domain-containing protein, partial [Candidatus Dojkabacteria bacterium]